MGNRDDEALVPVEITEISGSARLPEAGDDTPLRRETTARWLGMGVFCAFAVAVLGICIAHVVALCIMSDPPPIGGKLTATEMEAWFRWRQQLSDSVSGFAQTVGALLAGPLGVALGFYFRDRAGS